MPTPVLLGRLQFKSIKAATTHARSQIKRVWQEKGARSVATVDSQHPDFEFFQSLAQNHPEQHSKFPGGVLGFEVRQNPMNRAALGVYADVAGHGLVDFSWLQCCGARSPSNLLCAMRMAVRPSMQAFRRNAHPGCVLCSAGHMHVDHENPSFSELSAAFLAARPTAPPDAFDDHPELHMAVFRREDSGYEESWKRYHDENATLRMLCQHCNLTRPRGAHGYGGRQWANSQ